MKTLIVYYSRTGVTRTVAGVLAEQLGADVEELHDRKDRGGAMGYILAGKDATLKRLADIDPPQKDPGAYDLVVLGTPVWAFTMAPAIRTYLTRHGAAIKKAGAFCTMGGSGDKRTFRHVAELLGKPPAATLTLLEKDVRQGAFVAAAKEFVARLTGGA
ncbi:MAG: flavodoxin [Phycisphaerae bacterium]|jgi:flavodoxin